MVPLFDLSFCILLIKTVKQGHLIRPLMFHEEVALNPDFHFLRSRMNERVRSLLNPLLFLAVAGFLTMQGEIASAQQQPKAPLWSHAFDLSCRKFGESDFTKDTKKYGLEVFKDINNGLGVFICQTGDLAATTNFDKVSPPIKDSKAPVWTAGLDLKARKAGELEFTDKTKTYALEVFYDENTGNWIYVTEVGRIAVATGTNNTPKDLKSPKWLHSIDLKVRKGGEKEWKDAKAYGLEIYQDMNNDNLIYISETGAIAVVPGGAPEKADKKAPDWFHGQDLQCRKYGEPDFTKKTRKYGIEIFRDNYAGNWVILSETGNIAVLPADPSMKAPTKDPKDAKFTHGLDLSVRTAGVKDFTKDTKTYALEVFTEPNIGATLYLCETGAITAVTNKK